MAGKFLKSGLICNINAQMNVDRLLAIQVLTHHKLFLYLTYIQAYTLLSQK